MTIPKTPFLTIPKFSDVPKDYARKVRWLPQIGDIVPNFRLTTTQGPLTFHSWAEGSWTVLFSHPAAFTPVCTTEMGAMALLSQDFEDAGIKLLGISRSEAEDQTSWIADIEALFNAEVTWPMGVDPDGSLSGLFGLIHEKESAEWPVRKTLVIDPSLRLRVIFEYPIFVARSTEEVLRTVEALQTVDAFGVGIPSDWQKGDDCLLSPFISEHDRDRMFGKTWRKIRDYMISVPDPWTTVPQKQAAASVPEDDKVVRLVDG